MSEWNKKTWIILLTSCFVVIMTWGIVDISGANEYIYQIKQSSNKAAMSLLKKTPSNEQMWIEKITAESNKRKIAAIDAKVDRVWKAIPGYNGLEVDIQKTLELNKAGTEDQSLQFVYKEIKPKVNLQELGAYPIYKGNPQKPMVSLLINVAWGDEFIPTLLKVLNKENVHATFFFDGSWLLQHLDMAKLIGKAGHELSNHAYSHKDMSKLRREKATSEIVKTQQLLETKLGVKNTLFAPPSGDFNEETVRIAHELHLKTILWTIDTVDWMKPKPEWIVNKVKKNLEPGAMILMHPTNASSLALEAIIQEVKRRGFVLGTVSDLLSTDRVNTAQTIH
jgi:probable sporulation protein (polysaccharide deacetylase family)